MPSIIEQLTRAALKTTLAITCTHLIFSRMQGRVDFLDAVKVGLAKHKAGSGGTVLPIAGKPT